MRLRAMALLGALVILGVIGSLPGRVGGERASAAGPAYGRFSQLFVGAKATNPIIVAVQQNGGGNAIEYRRVYGAGTPTAVLFKVDGNGSTTIRGDLTSAGAHYGVTSTVAAVLASTPYAPVRPMNPISIATAGTVPLTIPSAGWYGCITNVGTEVITIADSGAQMLTAAAALGQYDVLCGDSDGTNFIERSRANN